jgi:glycosyltransferase involved in cell wall biosynthesis
MRIIINCSNARRGGALQVSLSFLYESLKCSENEYHVFLSEKLKESLAEHKFPDNYKFYPFKQETIYSRMISSFKLFKMERTISPDIVFTVFGPAYWKPKAPHVMGFAMGQMLYSDLAKTAGFKSNNAFVKFLKRMFVKYTADHYILETQDAASRLSERFKIPKSKISVVSNTYNSNFLLQNGEFNSFPMPKKADNEFRLLTVSAFYPHKNLEIIKSVIPFLKSSELKIKFILTINDEDYKQYFAGYEDIIINLGPVKSSDCPSVYEQCDFMFLPTLLEVFSANYPEAMIMKLPILTSDLPFARTICQDSATYFDPKDPEDIANKILKLLKSPERQLNQIESGMVRLGDFDTAEQRMWKYMSICKNLLDRGPVVN